MSRRLLYAALLFTTLSATAAVSTSARQTATTTVPTNATRELTPAARVTHEPLNEISGIVKSQRYPNVFWVHNDSGDVPRIFAIRGDGTVIMPGWLGGDFYVGATAVEGKKPYPGISVGLAANSDWEDIALDNDTLYLADVGNNGNARRDLGVYVVPEPNPEAIESTRAIKWLPVAYPDQEAFPGSTWQFDCEAVFVHRGKLHFVTKHRAAGQINTPATGASLYRLDSDHTDRVNVLKKLDGLTDLGGWVTAADLSPDGKTLAVLCQAPVASVWLFEVGKTGDRLLSGAARRLLLTGAKQCEAICFDNNDRLIVMNEQRDIFRFRVADFTPATPGR